MILNEIGRIDNELKIELRKELEEIFQNLDKNKLKIAEKSLYKISKTPNYFTREFLGKKLAEYPQKELMESMAQKMMKHRIYGIRATGLFFMFNSYYEDVDKLLELIEDNFDSVPWEVETIINDLWKRFPDMMKVHMTSWVDSDHFRKRALSFHGMEHIAESDPLYIVNTISKIIDDDVMEVQKKLTHILTQVARVSPGVVYPYVREWLATGNESRIKTIWVSMKKLTNMVANKNRREYVDEFVMLTEQTINDWRSDENEYVAEMGQRLYRILN